MNRPLGSACVHALCICVHVYLFQCLDKSVIILLWDGNAKKDNSGVIRPSCQTHLKPGQ